MHSQMTLHNGEIVTVMDSVTIQPVILQMIVQENTVYPQSIELDALTPTEMVGQTQATLSQLTEPNGKTGIMTTMVIILTEIMPMHSQMIQANGRTVMEMVTVTDRFNQMEISSPMIQLSGVIMTMMVLEITQMETTVTNVLSYMANPQYLRQEGALIQIMTES